MTYVDTTLVPEASYTYVNCKQFYDAVAAAMTTHPAWDYVEYVDTTSGGDTYRRHVWKCLASQSGLGADFFVVFQVAFVTATGLYYTAQVSKSSVKVWMGETYSAGVLGRFATNNTSVTLAADRSNPATFTLATFTLPTTLWDSTSAFGSTTNITSARFFALVAKDVLVVSRAADTAANITSTVELLYIGAYESVMNLTDDPLPIVVTGTNQNNTPWPCGGTTRAPTMTPSTAYTEVFGVSNSANAANSAVRIGNVGSWLVSAVGNVGTIGSPGITTWFKNYGGPWVSRLMLGPSSSTSNNFSTKGVFRGYLKYVYGATLPAHTFGDTFVVDGKVHVGTGLNGGAAIVDTEAV